MFYPNAIDIAIMQSSEDTDKLIACFEKYIKKGYDPNDVIGKVFNECGIRESDLEQPDILRINRTVEKLYRRYH